MAFLRGGSLMLFKEWRGVRGCSEDGLMLFWCVVDMLMLGVSCCFVAVQSDSDVGDRLAKP
jgi:hypothetical protein